MAKGRKPIPRGIKQLFGNPGKRKLNDQEPRPDAGLPDPPDYLNDEQKAVWAALGGQLARIGVMSHIDANAFARYCIIHCRFLATKKLLDDWEKDGKTGPVCPAGSTLTVHPFHTALMQYSKELRALESEFGLSPASRTRLKVDPGRDSPADSDPFEASLN